MMTSHHLEYDQTADALCCCARVELKLKRDPPSSLTALSCSVLVYVLDIVPLTCQLLITREKKQYQQLTDINFQLQLIS